MTSSSTSAGILRRSCPGGLSRELARVDADNLARLKAIVVAHGWPPISVVGVDAARAALDPPPHAEHVRQLREMLGVTKDAPALPDD